MPVPSTDYIANFENITTWPKGAGPCDGSGRKTLTSG